VRLFPYLFLLTFHFSFVPMAPNTRNNSEAESSQTPVPPSQSLNQDLLGSVLLQLMDRLERQPTPQESSSLGSEPKDSHPIESFSGRKRFKYRDFMLQCEAAFIERPRYFEKDSNRVVFVGRNLTDLALSWYITTISNADTRDLMYDWEHFKLEFHKSFGDPDEIASANRRLQKIHMGPNEDCISYITRFREIHSILNWDDEPMMFAFRQGLTNKIRDDLAYNRSKPESLEELMTLAQDADSRHRENQADFRNNESSSSGSSFNRRNKPKGKGFSRPSVSASPSPRFSSLQRDDKSSLSFLTKDNKINQSERDRRIKNGLCMYCGKGKHHINDCRLRQEKQQGNQSLSARSEISNGFTPSISKSTTNPKN
jgi:hypothetical protein